MPRPRDHRPNDRRGARRLALAATAALALAACGQSTEDDATLESLPPATETTVDAPALAAPRQASTLDQPAIWPAADVVFATPEGAATDFVRVTLVGGGEPTLGEFRAGDARSGEIDVLFAGETGDLDPPLVKGTVLLRQLGPTDGWYVIAATSPGASIDRPAALDEVAAGPLEVAGEANGFEGTLNIAAFAPGEFDAPIDSVIGAGGAFPEDPEPYTATVDLSAAPPGDVVTLMVRGDTGLSSDPSTFAAVPVVVAESAPTAPTDAPDAPATIPETE